MDKDNIVTLIGIRMAKPGTEFVFKGKSPECSDCRIKSTCLNLDAGGHYRVVRVRNTSPLDCSIHDGGVQAVEVEEAPITVLLESRKAFDGSTINYEPVSCNESECKIFDACQKTGAVPGEKYRISKIIGEPEGECLKEYSLKLVEMEK